MPEENDLTLSQYRDLAEFRRQIRQFLHFSETAAKELSIEAQQHQLMLAVRGLPDGVSPTIGELADRLFIQHHSAVELVNRMEANGAVKRVPVEHDKRQVLIVLTPAGISALHRLALAHRNELDRSGPELARALQSVLRHSRSATAS